MNPRPRRSRFVLFAALAFLFIRTTEPVLAHDAGLSFVTGTLSSNHLELIVTFAPRDLDGIGPEATGSNSPVDRLRSLAPAFLQLEQNATPLDPTKIHVRADGTDNIEIRLGFDVVPGAPVDIRCAILPALPNGHRQFISISDENGQKLIERFLTIDADSVHPMWHPGSGHTTSAARSSFGGFLVLGIKHILTGYDHLLFLFGLLIVTRTFASAVKIITCFTIAHSITLAAATLNLVHFPAAIVEPAIAASIVYVGIENLFRGDNPPRRWLLTLGFGLVHGFGFASVLRDLGVGQGTAIAVPLVSFNLGVELGQIAVAALCLPVILKLRTKSAFVQCWVPACSVLIALAGGFWFVQRIWF